MSEFMTYAALSQASLSRNLSRQEHQVAQEVISTVVAQRNQAQADLADCLAAKAAAYSLISGIADAIGEALQSGDVESLRGLEDVRSKRITNALTAILDDERRSRGLR